MLPSHPVSLQRTAESHDGRGRRHAPALAGPGVRPSVTVWPAVAGSVSRHVSFLGEGQRVGRAEDLPYLTASVSLNTSSPCHQLSSPKTTMTQNVSTPFRGLAPPNQNESHGPVRHLSLSVDTPLYARVAKAATAAGMHIAPWLRAMVRQITTADFPASWEAERSEERSHDSRIDGRRVVLQLDTASETTLQPFMTPFGASKAAIIRQFLRQAAPKDFPTSWQMRANARGRHQGRQIVLR
jgi:hypothetical protein